MRHMSQKTTTAATSFSNSFKHRTARNKGMNINDQLDVEQDDYYGVSTIKSPIRQSSLAKKTGGLNH